MYCLRTSTVLLQNYSNLTTETPQAIWYRYFGVCAVLAKLSLPMNSTFIRWKRFADRNGRTGGASRSFLSIIWRVSILVQYAFGWNIHQHRQYSVPSQSALNATRPEVYVSVRGWSWNRRSCNDEHVYLKLAWSEELSHFLSRGIVLVCNVGWPVVRSCRMRISR